MRALSACGQHSPASWLPALRCMLAPHADYARFNEHLGKAPASRGLLVVIAAVAYEKAAEAVEQQVMDIADVVIIAVQSLCDLPLPCPPCL